MPDRRLCFFNLTDNFHPFFFHLAKELSSNGVEALFLNFWPGEIQSIRINGLSDRLMDWKSDFLSEREVISNEDLDRWISLDPRYLASKEEDKEGLKEQFREGASYLLPTFRRMIETYRLDAVFFWNGYRFPEPIFLHACKEMNLPVLFGENGFFSHTMQIDPNGINAASSLSDRSDDEWFGSNPQSEPRFAEFLEAGGNLKPQGNPLPEIKRVSKPDRIKSLLDPFLIEKRLYDKIPRKSPFGNSRDNRRIARVKATRPTSKNVPLPDDYLFLPFQVHDDTQIVIHSPWVSSMKEMIKKVLQAKKDLGFSEKVVVKEHPVDVGRFDYTAMAKQAPVTWLWDYPLDKVMNGSKTVVTVNSSVGVEAIVRGLPLVTLGNAVYNIEGICYHAQSQKELNQLLEQSLVEKPNTELRHQFLHKLRFEDMVDASWGRPTDSGVANAARRIVGLLRW